MFKKGFFCGIFFCITVFITVNAATAIREISYGVHVLYNGTYVNFDEDTMPFVMNGRTFLPVRTIAEITGLNVDFYGGTVMLSSPDFYSRRFSEGEWHGNTFTSNYLDFSFIKPSDWVISETSPPYDMSVTSPLGATVRIRYDRATPNYFETTMLNAAQPGINLTRNISTTQIGDYHWHSFHTEMEITDMELNVFGHYFINIEAGMARVITIIRPDISESFDEILGMFV